MRIHREGRLIVPFTLAATLALAMAALILEKLYFSMPLLVFALVICILVLRFFRDPLRQSPGEEDLVLAPADGRVVVVERTREEEFLEADCIQLSIFMSIHNVHVNRHPVEGRVIYQKYHPGAYLLARHPKSSELNERNSLAYESRGKRILMRQIAGYVARRIRWYVGEGEAAVAGDEMGFIRFGSRVDIFLPADSEILVRPGDRVKGGLDTIARLT